MGAFSPVAGFATRSRNNTWKPPKRLPMLFRKLQDFNHLNVSSVSPEPEIYIIYKRVRGIDRPFYIGRSRVDLRARLWCHLRGAGSRKVAAAILWGERL